MGINIRKKYGNDNPPEKLLGKFVTQLDSHNCPCSIHIANNLITLKVLEADARWWSPELNLRIRKEGGETTLNEVTGPNPATFTFSMFFVFFGAVVFIAAFIMMLAQIQLGISSTLALLGSALSIIVVIAAFLVLAIGRLKARTQVAMLQKFVKKVLAT